MEDTTKLVEETPTDDLVVENPVVDDTTAEVEDPQATPEDTEEVEATPEESTEEPNPEDSFYTQGQVEAAVKARVKTFNKKIEKMKPYESAVKKISELTGMDVNTLIGRLEGLSVADQAKVLGITPEQFQAQKSVQQLQRTREEENTKLQRELEEQKLMVNPAYRDMPLFREEVLELMDDNPKLSMKQAYTLVKGESGLEAVKRDAEQRAVAKMTKSSNQRVVKPGSAPVSKAPKLDSVTLQAAQKVGMDPAEYAAFSNISSLDEYEAMVARKKS